MAEFLTIEHFKPLIGQRVGFRGAERTLVLDRIHTDGKPLIPTAQRIAFMLIFAEPKGETVLPTGLYDCEFENGTVWPIYVSPVHTPALGRQEYQALFD